MAGGGGPRRPTYTSDESLGPIVYPRGCMFSLLTLSGPLKDHVLIIKLQHLNNFKICDSDDLYVMILLLEFEMMGK